MTDIHLPGGTKLKRNDENYFLKLKAARHDLLEGVRFHTQQIQAIENEAAKLAELINEEAERQKKEKQAEEMDGAVSEALKNKIKKGK